MILIYIYIFFSPSKFLVCVNVAGNKLDSDSDAAAILHKGEAPHAYRLGLLYFQWNIPLTSPPNNAAYISLFFFAAHEALVEFPAHFPLCFDHIKS